MKYGQCQARGKKHNRGGRTVCIAVANTVRRIEGAPGLWIHVELCHNHQYVWDEGGRWGGAILYREKLSY